MASYYDSSLLLATILGQFQNEECLRAWDAERVRLSSILLGIECLIGLRRIAQEAGHRPDGKWAKARVEAVAACVDTVTLRNVDAEIEAVIRAEPRLAGCRALDAVHLATALHFQSRLDEPLHICTLDVRMRAVAAGLGFSLRPARMPAPGA